jgi:integrase
MTSDPLTGLPVAARNAFMKSVNANDELSERTKNLYAHTWSLWVKWLAARGKAFDEAQPEDVAAFLSGGAPGQGRRRQPKDETRMKPFTRQRYWRVLNEVYRLRRSNPAYALVKGPDDPIVPQRDRHAEVLPPRVLAMLRDPLWLRGQIPDCAGAREDWTAPRDRALVALLAHCGLSTGELIALTPASLMVGATRRLLECSQRDLPGLTGNSTRVHVPSTRTLGRRTELFGEVAPEKLEVGQREVILPEEAIEIVWEWLLRWKHLGLDVHGPLFPAGRRRHGEHTALSAAMVFMIVRDCVRSALRIQYGEITKPSANSHGPAVVRNTVLQHWLAHLPRDEVARRAGLKDASSIRIPELGSAASV